MNLPKLMLAVVMLLSALLLVTAQVSQDESQIIDREFLFPPVEIEFAKLSPDGKHLCFSKRVEDQFQVFVKAIEAPMTESRLLTKGVSAATNFHWNVGGTAVLIKQIGKDSLLQIAIADQEKQWVAADANSADLHEASNELFPNLDHDANEQPSFRNQTLRVDYMLMKQKLPEGNCTFLEVSADQRKVLLTQQSWNHPPSYYVFDRDNKRLYLQSLASDQIEQDLVASKKTVQYKGNSGEEFTAFLSDSKYTQGKKQPAVLLVSGEPSAKFEFDAMQQFLHSRGYLVMQPIPRDEVDGNWPPEAEELIAAAGFLQQQEYVHQDQIALVHCMQGTGVVLDLLSGQPGIFDAAVAVTGTLNLNRWQSKDADSAVKGAELITGNPVLVGSSLANEATNVLIDEIKYIPTPLLLIQGFDEPKLSRMSTDKLMSRLYQDSQMHKYLCAVDESTEFSRRDNKMATIVEIEMFLHEQIGGAFQSDLSDDISDRRRLMSVDIARLQTTEAEESEAEVTLDFVSTAKGRESRTVETQKKPKAPKPRDILAEGNAQEDSQENIEETHTSRAKSSGSPSLQLPRPIHIPKEGQYLYELQIEGQEKDVSIELQRRIYFEDGHWVVVDTSNSSGGSIVDMCKLKKGSLLPAQRLMQQGELSVKLDFGDQVVNGQLLVQGRSQEMSQSISQTVFCDSGGLDLTLASLPLQKGYEASYCIFDFQSSQTRCFDLVVVAEESIKSGGGDHECYKLEIREQGLAEGSQLLWIAKETGRFVVRSEMQIPEMGTAILTLKQALH